MKTTAKSLVMRPAYKIQNHKDKTKYDRKKIDDRQL